MVKGIDLFRERLGAFFDSYIVIGGTACGCPFYADCA